MARNPQLQLLKRESLSYGGTLLNTRKGRSHGRPISTRESMHLVLHSAQAVGDWSFQKPQNKRRIEEIVRKFSAKYSVQVMSLGNVGNHLHFHIKLGNRASYRPFIRALTGAIAMAVTGVSRWKRVAGVGGKVAGSSGVGTREKFWDFRPFTRVVRGFKAFLSLRDYIDLNHMEGLGLTKKLGKSVLTITGARPWLIRPSGKFG
ncbi:MAG: hypothetical protein ABL958_05235 [Bdellovibrionia bacterium]